MNIREMRLKLGVTQNEFARRYRIPLRTIQNWENDLRNPPNYIIRLLEDRVKMDIINRKTISLPRYDPRKKDLPKRSEYIGSLSWLKAVCGCLGKSIVFALDEALMCQGVFGGRNEEFIVWVYGDSSASQYNGVVVIGNHISPNCVQETNGLRYTNFNRTLSDAFANESILDMQGITEALSRYYYQNGNCFEGIHVNPEYQERFESLAQDAINYYNEV